MSRPRKSFYILLPILSGLLALLLVELGLALFYPIPFSLEKNMYFEPNPHTGFFHRPSTTGHYLNGIEARANSQGLRDDEVAIPKPAGVKRVQALGDSFTVGADVEQHDAWPQVLEQLLNEPGKPAVEVVNAGVGGWSPFQYAQFYEHYGDQFEPDLIVVGFFVGNDTYADRFRVEDTLTAVMGRRMSRENGDGALVKLRVLLYENSHVARALTSGGRTDLRFERDDCGDFNDYFLTVQAGRLFNHMTNLPGYARARIGGNVREIRRLNERAAARGIPVLVVLIPDENQINPALQAAIVEPGERDTYDFDMPQKLLREMFAANDIAWLDLLKPFAADPRCLYMNDSHWVAAGHRFAAERIRDYIEAGDLL